MLYNIIKKVEPLFAKGGKLERLFPLFEGTATLLYNQGNVTKNTTTHVRDNIDLKRMMIMVFFAVFPAMFWGWYNIGNQTIEALKSFIEVAQTSHSLFGENYHYAIVQMLGGT